MSLLAAFALPGRVGKAFSSCHLEQFQPGTRKKKRPRVKLAVPSTTQATSEKGSHLPELWCSSCQYRSRDSRQAGAHSLPEISAQTGPCGRVGFLFCDWPDSTGPSSRYTPRKLEHLPLNHCSCVDSFTRRACLFINDEALISGSGWRCQSSSHRPDLAKTPPSCKAGWGRLWDGFLLFQNSVTSLFHM